MLATFDHSQFELSALLALKTGPVSVCVPTRETAATIAGTVRAIAALRDAGLVDQILVVDADSADGTATIAREAGAEVFQEAALLPEFGPVEGKGDAMWRALSVAGGEIVVYLDGDVSDFGEHYVTGLLGPLLQSERVDFVKGFYRRPLALDGMEIEDGGGRVTELTAKPLLELLVPELAAFSQPLAGECAARRSLLSPRSPSHRLRGRDRDAGRGLASGRDRAHGPGRTSAASATRTSPWRPGGDVARCDRGVGRRSTRGRERRGSIVAAPGAGGSAARGARRPTPSQRAPRSGLRARIPAPSGRLRAMALDACTPTSTAPCSARAPRSSATPRAASRWRRRAGWRPASGPGSRS